MDTTIRIFQPFLWQYLDPESGRNDNLFPKTTKAIDSHESSRHDSSNKKIIRAESDGKLTRQRRFAMFLAGEIRLAFCPQVRRCCRVCIDVVYSFLGHRLLV